MSPQRESLGSVSKAVIPAAGLGTRLLSATKEQPKEMLPLFASDGGTLCLKPVVQQIFEQLFDFGLREFCFVVGKGKRAIEDHFTPDRGYVRGLNAHGKSAQAIQLERFYDKIEASTLVWVNQPEPRGFGHAVLLAKPLVDDEPFLVHAGDTYVISGGTGHLAKMFGLFAKAKPEAVFVVKHMPDVKERGVMEGREKPGGIYAVDRVVEKPDRPTSNLAIEPIYLFRKSIFEALKKTEPGKGGEVQLTDAIQQIIASGREVIAWRLNESDLRLDIGSAESYWQALLLSHNSASKTGSNQ